MNFKSYPRRATSADGDEDAVAKPRHGDRDVKTADEIGRKRARDIALKSQSPSAKTVQQIVLHTDWDMVVARKFVHDPHNPGQIVPRAIGWTATGRAESGDFVASTHVARIGAVVNGDQTKSLRHVANCVLRTEGEATEMFAFVRKRDWLEAAVLSWGGLDDVGDHQVPSKALKDFRHWMRGDDLRWLKLESWAAKRAAAEMRSTLERIRDAEELINRARSAGIEPDERVIHRRQELHLGLGNSWIFVGARLITEVDREPSVEVVEAANGKNK